jgi:predicted RNA methylase
LTKPIQMLDVWKNVNWNGRTFGYDLLMINDRQRNQFYQDALGDIQGAVVLDIGAGTGLLSVMAVMAGARKVYAFERDPNNFLALTQLIADSHLTDKIEIIFEDILEVDRESWSHEPIDVIITETFANDCFLENFGFLCDHVEKHFNLSRQCRWIPEKINLDIAMVDVPLSTEFDPGVAVPQIYSETVGHAIQIYRDSLYQKYSTRNLSVAQIPDSLLGQLTRIYSFSCDGSMISQLSKSHVVEIDHSRHTNPYLKVEWSLESQGHLLAINQSVSWRSIAYKVDKNRSDNFYLRFNPHSHALLISQI